MSNISKVNKTACSLLAATRGLLLSHNWRIISVVHTLWQNTLDQFLHFVPTGENCIPITDIPDCDSLCGSLSDDPQEGRVSEVRVEPFKPDPAIHVLFGKEHASKGHGRDHYVATEYYRKRIKDLKQDIKNSSEDHVDKNPLVKRLYQELEEMGFICIEQGTILPKEKVLAKMKQALRNKGTQQNRSPKRKNDPKKRAADKVGKRSRQAWTYCFGGVWCIDVISPRGWRNSFVAALLQREWIEESEMETKTEWTSCRLPTIQSQ